VFQNEVYVAQENNIARGGYPTEFIKGARRCDSGGKKNPILEPMICEALRIVTSFDLNAVQSFMNRITDRILEKGKRMGFGVQPWSAMWSHDWSSTDIEGNGGISYSRDNGGGCE